MIKLPTKRTTLARNSHLVATAQRTLKAVTPIIQQQNFNSLQVSGYPVFIYNRLTGGKVCSCSLLHPLRGATPLYDNEGNASPSVMSTIVHQAQFGIEEYNPETAGNSISTPITVNPVTSIADGAVVEMEGEEDLTAEAQLDQGSAGSCPICQGTFFIGGYNFMQGMRKVLTHFDIQNYEDMYVTKTTAPYEINLRAGGWVEFNLLIPMLPANSPLPRVTVWNGYNRLLGNIQTLKAVPAVGSPYEIGGNQSPQGYGLTTIRLEADRFISADEEMVFTHIEIQIPQVSNPVYVDIPNLTQSYDPTHNILYQATSFTLPPSVPLLKPWDVIADMKYQVLWLVTTVRPVAPSDQSLWSQEVDVRPIEPHEAMHNLAIPSQDWVAYPDQRGTIGKQPVKRTGGY